jgi:hypothetical protein
MFMVSGCGTIKSLFHHTPTETVVTSPDSKTLWHFRYQYVRIEPQGACPGLTVPPNSQPAQISSEELYSALAALNIIAPESPDPQPLFNPTELDRIAGLIAAGLAKCSAHEDVTFTILGAHKGDSGYQNVVTAGRIFLIKNQLNLILGTIHKPVNDFDAGTHGGATDYRRVSFPNGARCKAATPPYRILVSPPAIQLHDQGGIQRQDWVTMDLSLLSRLPPQTTPEGRQKYAFPQEASAPATQPTAPTATATAPGGQPHETTPPVTTMTSGQQAPPQMKAARADVRTLEERLELLKHLHDQNLITDQDYKAKKKELLNEL